MALNDMAEKIEGMLNTFERLEALADVFELNGVEEKDFDASAAWLDAAVALRAVLNA